MAVLNNEVVSSDPVRVRYVTLKGPMIDAWLAALPDAAGGNDVQLLHVPRLQALMVHVTDEKAWRSDPSGWAWMGYLAQCLNLLDKAMRDGVTEDIMVQVRRLIDSHPRRPWKVPSIARKLRIAESTLARRFRERSGVSLMQWVREKRMHYAANLLANGMSVADVADQMHASSPYSFSRCFKEVLGVNPSQIQFEGLQP